MSEQMGESTGAMAEGMAPVADVGAVVEPALEEVLTPQGAVGTAQPVVRPKEHESQGVVQPAEGRRVADAVQEQAP